MPLLYFSFNVLLVKKNGTFTNVHRLISECRLASIIDITLNFDSTGGKQLRYNNRSAFIKKVVLLRIIP
jgi:hypothetical protein